MRKKPFLRRKGQKLERIKTAIRNPARVYDWLSGFGLANWVSDGTHLKLMWKSVFGPDATLDLKNPKTFNEKLQWLKLHDRNPLYTTLVDKYAVKQWVADRIGSEYVTETYSKWDRAEDIDIADLPDNFVLKTNHDCGGIAICRDRSSFDLNVAKRKLAKHMRRNYFYGGREWPYKDVKPCIFAEEYLEPGESGDLTDYKFFCFDGKADCVMLCTGRATGSPKFYFLDRGWDILKYNLRGLSLSEDMKLRKPDRADEMFALAEKLSEGIPFVRVDFYCERGRILFGEMTFFPQSGFDANILPESDARWGSMIDLDKLV